jgi:hypothetical protein
MIWRLLALAIALLPTLVSAQSSLRAFPPGMFQSRGALDAGGGGGGGYTGPGDVVSGAAMWWGLRCYNTAYTGNVADIWDTATGSTTETLLTCSSGGTINETIHSLATTCATSCNVKTLYDQSGANSCASNPCDMVQLTNASRPIFTRSCIGSLPCIAFTSANSQYITQPAPNTYGGQAQPFTYSGVGYETTAVNGSILIFASGGGNNFEFRNTPSIQLNGGSNFSVASSTATWYAIQGLANGASSILYINGASTGGSAGTNAIAASVHPQIGLTGFGEFCDCRINEVGFWGSAFTAPQQSSMNANQRAYWGF